MKQVRSGLLIGFLLSLLAGPVSALDLVPTSLKLESLGDRELYWLRKAGKYEKSGSGVIFHPAGGDDLYVSVDGKDKNFKSPVLLLEPEGDFVLSARVSFDSKQAYDGGALVVYSDPGRWAKYLFEVMGSGDYGTVMNAVTDGLGDVAYYSKETTNSVFLEVRKENGALVFSSSPDGENWERDRIIPASRFPDLKVGFEAQSPSRENLAVKFDSVSYQALK